MPESFRVFLLVETILGNNKLIPKQIDKNSQGIKMKKITKNILIVTGTVLVLIVLTVGFMFWKMGQPIYNFGVVSTEGNLRSPLEPPEQTDSTKWQVEPDISLHFEVYGKGRPVIIVHGGPGIPYANAWKGLKSLEDQYAFYYYHQRGAGLSTRPIDRFESKNYPKNVTELTQTLGLGAQIADIERIRRILKEEKLLLIGHSFGGFVASLYAAEFPGMVEKLILVAPAGMLTPPQKGNDIFEIVRHKIPEDEQSEYNRLVKEYFNFGSIFKKTENELVDLHTQIGHYLVKGMGYDISDLDTPPKPGGWSSFAVYFSIGKSPDFRHAVSHILAPTLILHGKDDDISLNGSKVYDEHIPNAKFVSLDCKATNSISGHFIFHDCPEQFAESVKGFLDN